jgi:hypothetical protein
VTYSKLAVSCNTTRCNLQPSSPFIGNTCLYFVQTSVISSRTGPLRRHCTVLYLVHYCVLYITAHCTLLYIVHYCTLNITVYCTLLYIVNYCTLYITVHCALHCILMHTVNYCTFYITLYITVYYCKFCALITLLI